MADIGRGLIAAGQTDIVGQSMRVSEFLSKAKAAEEAAKLRKSIEDVRLPLRSDAPETSAAIAEPTDIGGRVGMDIGTQPAPNALDVIKEQEDSQVMDIADVPVMKQLAPYPSAQNLLKQVAEINGWIENVGGVPTISQKNMAIAQQAISQDLELHKTINELALNDISTTAAQIESALADPKLKDDQRQQLTAQLDEVNKTKNATLNAINVMDRKIQQEAATRQPAVAKPMTTDVLEAEVLDKARTAGLGALNPAEKAIYDKAVSVSKGVQISVGAGEKKFDEEFGAASVKTLTDAISNGRKAQDTLNKFDVMDNLLNKINTGKFAGVKKGVAQVAKGLGIEIDPKLGDVEAFDSMANQLALTLKDQLPGPMSDADREFLQRSTVELTKTRAGNKILVEIGKRVASRNIEAAKLATQMAQEAKKRDERFSLVEYEAELDRRFKGIDSPSMFEGLEAPETATGGITTAEEFLKAKGFK